MTRSVGRIAVAIAIGWGTVWANSAQAQRPLPQMRMTSDFDAPYDVAPPEAAFPPRVYGPRYGAPDERPSFEGPSYDGPRYAPTVLAPTDVYGILRRTGYSPLGIPQQRGFVYTISVISPDGDDGRLVIDARTGRILRFMPAFRMGDRMNDQVTVSYGPPAPVPPLTDLRGPPRPAPPLPRGASRTSGATPARPVAKAATVPAVKPADAQASIQQPVPAVPAAPPAVIEARPPASPAILPTQDIPAAQGLD